MEDGAEVGGAEDQDELREASVNIRLGVLCSRRPACMNCRFIHESLLDCLLPNRLKNKRFKNKCVHSQQHFLIQVIEKKSSF